MESLIVNLGNREYRIDRPWGKLPNDVQLGSVSQLAVDSNDNLYLAQRSDPPVVVFDPEGNYLNSWGTSDLVDSHGIYISGSDDVLIVDRDAHQIIKFDLAGNVTARIGERHQPRFRQPFNHPTGVAIASDGEVYVSDGYGNSRIHRFTSNGDHIASWGEPGSGPGQFTTPHTVWVTADDRVLVADRENNRVQVFDRGGKYLTEWTDHFHPMDIWEDSRGLIYVTDQIPRLSLLAPDGGLVGRCRPVPQMAHGIWGDSRGNLYCCETSGDVHVSRLTRIDQLEDDEGEMM